MQPTTANASAVSAALAEQAESVCRHFLPNGRREGRYWIVGNVHGSPGKSLIIRLRGPGRPGKWNDMATGDHGDLLDIIRHRSAGSTLRDALAEARAFLAIPQTPPAPSPAPPTERGPCSPAPRPR
ncbi:MAG: DNA primase, partial [Alphaproteobacteria bacterium]|nr:DNA primase [Alphaproteobacteria bacterium]